MKSNRSIKRKHDWGRGVVLLSFLLVGCPAHRQSFVDPWPQYRGPDGAGVSPSTARINPWAEDGAPHRIWKQPLGDGFSGIALSGEQLIVAFGADSSEYLAGFDRITGEENWRCPIGDLFVETFGNGPRATPAVDGDQAFICNSWGHLYGVDVRTGRINWKAALSDSFKIPMIEPRRGFSSSPLIIDEKVIVYTGGPDNTAFMALNKHTGEVVWKTGGTRGSYSTPILADIHGTRQILFTTTSVVEENGEKKGVYEVVSLTPDGDILWRGPGLPGVIAMPVFVPPDRIFVSSQLEIGSKLIKATAAEERFIAEEVWSSPHMRNHFNSSIHHRGHLYGFSNATLECIDAETAERKWRKRGLGKGSLILADDKLLVMTDKGKLVVAEASPDGFHELCSAQVIQGKSWTSPTFADGKLYVRNRKEIACYDLTK